MTMAKDTNYANAMSIYQMYGAESPLKSFCQHNKINYARFYKYLREHEAISEGMAQQEPSEARMCPVEITEIPLQSDIPILDLGEYYRVLHDAKKIYLFSAGCYSESKEKFTCCLAKYEQKHLSSALQVLQTAPMHFLPSGRSYFVVDILYIGCKKYPRPLHHCP